MKTGSKQENVERGGKRGSEKERKMTGGNEEGNEAAEAGVSGGGAGRRTSILRTRVEREQKKDNEMVEKRGKG